MKYIKIFNPTSKSFHVKTFEIKPNDSIMLAPYEGDKSLNFINALKRSGLTVSIVNLSDTPANVFIKKHQFKITDTTKKEKVSEVTETVQSETKSAKVNQESQKSDRKTVEKESTNIAVKEPKEKTIISEKKSEEKQEVKKEPEVKQRKKPGPKPKAKTEQTKKPEAEIESEKSSSDKA